MNKPTINMPPQGRTIAVVGDVYRFLATGEDTNGIANMPVGTPHSFKNECDCPAKMLISVAPAGLEQMFFEVGVPLVEGATTGVAADQG